METVATPVHAEDTPLRDASGFRLWPRVGSHVWLREEKSKGLKHRMRPEVLILPPDVGYYAAAPLLYLT